MTVESTAATAASRTEAAESESAAADTNHELHNSDAIETARELAERIHKSADVLLEKLLSHLSELPESPSSNNQDDDDEDDLGEERESSTSGNDETGDNSKNSEEEEETMLKRGLTVPITAVAWLSDQLEALDILQKEQQPTSELESSAAETTTADDKQGNPKGHHHHSTTCDLEPWLGLEAAKSLRYRLNLLRFLLPRAQLIRLNRQAWPPRSSSNKDRPSFLCSASSPKQQLKKWWKKRQRQQQRQNSDADQTDVESPTEANANEFLRYARRFEHGASKCFHLWRVFPNATVLILESVPPSWIDLEGGVPRSTCTALARNQNQASLRLISVTNAAMYDLQEFFPPLPACAPSSTALSTVPYNSSLQQSSPVSHSLTHLKLDNCSLGELTKGFSSGLAQLVHLEYLSLAHNQFRSAKTLLRGLRPLTRLRYLDVSDNQLVGCFGPYANLCLGGQVKTLKLSNNKLETCQNSGLEKCYALCELWLDSNNIQDVVEVSGLARLPDLQCLALQRNPFSTRKSKASFSNGSVPSSLSLTHDRDTTHRSNTLHGQPPPPQENPFFDPNWKIRLWTWFQHERRALTPLELPVLNKKTKHMGIHHNGCDAATIGRMTRDEWDQIQEESYAITTTATVSVTMTATRTNSSSNVPSNEEDVPSTEESNTLEKTPGTVSTLHEPSIPSPLQLAPVRNRKVVKKTKTRQARIHTIANKGRKNGVAESSNAIPDYQTNRARKRKQTRGKKKKKHGSSSELAAKENSLSIQQDTSNDDGKGSSLHVVGGKELNIGRTAPSSTKQFNCSELKFQQLSFSLEDVLISLQHEHLQGLDPPDKENDAPANILNDDKEIEADQDKDNKELFLSEEALVKCAANDDAPNNPFLEDDSSQHEVPPMQNDSTKSEDGNPSIQELKAVEADEECEANKLTSPEPTPLQAEEGKPTSDNTHVSEEGKENCDENDDIQRSKPTDEPSTKTQSVISSSGSSPKRTPRKSPKRSPRRTPRRPDAIDEDRIFVRPKVASIKLSKMGTKYKPFDALSSDWDDVIKKASEGRIPDGILKTPDDFVANDDVFSDKVDLLDNVESDNAAGVNPIDQASGSRSTSEPTVDPSVASTNRLASALPEHVWQDDNSVLSSLGASRDDMFPRRVNKFQLAEENCAYDGPETSRGLKVVENLQLYFEQFVFPTSTPDIPEDILEEMEEDQDDWQLITMYYPRIQLWPDDRRLLELERVRISPSMHSADYATSRERFLRVWEEDIVPCGKPALKRLPPNRRNRLGFHGDKLFENADVDAYAECRKVLLCLSSKAFYVIPEKDNVTMDHQQQAKKRRFPLPLDRGDRFRDAPWPHAVARHCLGELEAICIGFEFQRLTLRFRNQSYPKSDPFVYVLLTGDKRASVRILQEIQKLAKDLGENDLGMSSSAKKKSSAIDIENDSHIVLDSLHRVVDSSNQSIGTILHFQIVQQQWKHGDRGTVRRVCVITDTMILLLDEDYAADGHDLSSVTVEGKRMADARYRLVDQAALSLVSQVQAANADPRAITIIINPSTLSRTKRWRLICRDREGAERLVEDARKALEDA